MFLGGKTKFLIFLQIFLTYYELEIHQKEHAGERPFVCPICNRMFQEYGQAVVHGIAIHSTEITPRTTADEKRYQKAFTS